MHRINRNMSETNDEEEANEKTTELAQQTAIVPEKTSLDSESTYL